ncbi:alkanesulfonate monooxygenase [Arboricoccus pini]|uniref:Alkanesulfonate monooxygenase n=1 Tax=Arboricoccus pini TaxID=1963835 RepID=A0A212REP9_9PROT|nr:LLM class flavin-dependent oxidoreductase [Arboricoccus pini]SNB70843.1 alkanesulfonate monooxygenase [Arboricoccus pini]
MRQEIRLNAFDMNCVAHQSPGLWRHPRDRSGEYNRLGYWVELAAVLERGLFDGLFLADVLGVYDVYGQNADAALRNATQIPVNDPMLLVPAMAQATRHLGFGITCTLSYEPPFTFARRMSTLDHLTEGRIGWNIVTGYLDSAAKGLGRDRQNAHDDRYLIAEDYMEVVYKLWEGSWEEGAVLRDKERGIFTDPAKVHRVHHASQHHRLDAIHLAEPSLQRTPVLYQAGSSTKGRAFAGRHAECVFMSGPSPQVVAPRVQGVRQAAEEAGRDPASVLIFALATVIVAPTAAAAAAKHEEYRSYVSVEGALTLFSGWTGLDFSRYDPDQEIRYIDNDAGRSALENISRADPERVWTVREVAEHAGIGGIGPVIVGDPAGVADQLERWMELTGIDGFNLAYAVAPETFVDVVDLLVPELQKRGRYKQRYGEGTLREKLFPGGRRLLTPPHPAAGYRPFPASR